MPLHRRESCTPKRLPELPKIACRPPTAFRTPNLATWLSCLLCARWRRALIQAVGELSGLAVDESGFFDSGESAGFRPLEWLLFVGAAVDFAWQACGVRVPVGIRDLARSELSRIGEIDRTERIEVLFEQHGTELVARRGSWSASAWDPVGHGEHSVNAQ